MPRVYQSLVKATSQKAPLKSPLVRPQTPYKAPPELQPAAEEAAHTEADTPPADNVADTPHADVDDVDTDTASGPLSGMDPSVTMIPPATSTLPSLVPQPLPRLAIGGCSASLFPSCTTSSRLPIFPHSVRPMRHMHNISKRKKSMIFFIRTLCHF